jgi:hypothetical protein
MTVYVDESAWPYRGQLYCHMFTDQMDLAELHDLASRIGLRRSWFQDPRPGDHPHYDLSPAKRSLAIRYGAVETTARKAVGVMLERLARCTFLPGSFDKRFVRNLSGNRDLALSKRQAAYLEYMHYHYRGQLGEPDHPFVARPVAPDQDRLPRTARRCRHERKAAHEYEALRRWNAGEPSTE